MSDTTPAGELRAAADKLRKLVAAAVTDLNTNDYWASYDRSTAWQDGLTNGMGGASGDLAAAMGPDAARALADWLDSLRGIDFREDGPMPEEFTHALAVARAVLGTQEAQR